MAWTREQLDGLVDPRTGSLPDPIHQNVTSSRIFIACDYQSPVREGLLALKFADATEWHRLFAALLVQVVRQQGKRFSAVLAVPLHHRRFAERGYNQSGLIAASVARQLELPDWSSMLVRRRQTRRQSEQSARADRFANLSGAFAWTGPSDLRSAHVLLVDDVLTTGATLGASAEPLFRAGAMVSGLVVASNHRS